MLDERTRQDEEAGGRPTAIGHVVGQASWPKQIHDILKAAEVRQMSYVPDAGHTTLIKLFESDPTVTTNVLTTEEEGIPIAAGAWLGGQRSVLLMQSSGVGNCINMLSLPVMTRMPFLTLVTMRGEWAEFNPWQVPMGQGTQLALEAMGVLIRRADKADEVTREVAGAAHLAFNTWRPVAVLIGQNALGAKNFKEMTKT